MAQTLQLPSDVETWTAERVVAFAVEQFPGRVALACSFQKEETVLLDMLYAADAKARVFAIDTHHLFPETYDLWKAIEARYDTTIEVSPRVSFNRLIRFPMRKCRRISGT